MTTAESDTIDRRIHPRHPVDLEGRISASGKGAEACRISNLYLGGLLLQYAGEDTPLGLENNDVCDIHFKLPGNAGKPIHVEARVAHLVPGGIGVRFLRTTGDGMERLKAYIQQRSAAARPEADRPTPRGDLDTAEALEILRRISTSRLGALLESLLEHIQEQLWLASERAYSDAERADLQMDIALLAQAVRDGGLQKRIGGVLLDAIQCLESDQTAPPPSPDAADSELELVDKNRFDIWLANSALSHHLEQQFADSLDTLHRQTSQLFGEGMVLPVEPHGIADALETGLADLGLSALTQTHSLKSADQHLSANLGAYYRELSRAWEGAGLSGQAVTAQPAPDSPDAAGGAVADDGAQHASGMPGQGYSGPQLAELLHRSEDNRGADAQGQALSLGDHVRQLLGGVEGQGQPMLAPSVDHRVAATDRFLANMLDDPQVSGQFRDLIRSLAVRFLATAVSEPNLFSGTEHPLATVIDQLDHLSLLLPDDGKGAPGQVQEELERLMHQTLAADTQDPTLLQQISEKLRSLETRLGQQYQQRAESMVVNSEGRERVQLARAEVRRRVSQALAGKLMHKAVAALIDSGWLALLQLVYLREGDSAAWGKHWAQLLEMHGQCGGETDWDTGSYGSVADLLAGVREGLVFIGFDPFRCASLVRDLEDAVRKVRAGVEVEEAYQRFPPLDTSSSQTRAPAAPPGVDSAVWKKALFDVDAMNVGSALRYRHDRAEALLRLVWRSSDGAQLVFIQPPGMESRALERAALARAMVEKRAMASAPESDGLMARTAGLTLEQMQERISYHETHDTLTGLKNRRQLIKSLTQALSEHGEYFHPQVMGFVELDHFEAVTSTCGYAAGERMLVAVAKLLELSLEEARCIAYLGGSRFGYLTPARNAQDAALGGNKVCAAMSSLPFYWHGKSYPVAGSVGMVLVQQGSDNPESLLSAVDAACLAAQRAGGNRSVLFREEDEFIARQKDQMRWWMEAEGVVKAERLRLRGQLIAHADTDQFRPHHYEVLLSVFDEQGTPLPLLGFISSAEAFNLMGDVDRLVVEKALRWADRHPEKLREVGGLAINLSGQSVGNPGLVDFIGGHLRDLRVDTDLISFEVTETAAIANVDQAVTVIDGIKALGCRFALDDFGTGNASYTYLKRLPVDYLKIDGSFIKDVLTNRHDQAIVKSMIEIAHFMGKETIAEFVENQEVLEKLREMGIDYVQGYGVEKPRYLDELD